MSAAPATAPFPVDRQRRGLHQALREATRATHEGLHLHPGFLAVKNGTIGLAAYRALLCRLYGFHRPFEEAARIGADRSSWLRDDLAVLGADAKAVAGLPLCTLPCLENDHRQLGALYVVEGSALGGLAMGKGLDGLFGIGSAVGRRFFLGRGRETAASWSALLVRLAREDNFSAHDEIVAAAVQTFKVFEAWISD